jgi:hypothetical protein
VANIEVAVKRRRAGSGGNAPGSEDGADESAPDDADACKRVNRVAGDPEGRRGS